MSIEPEWSKWKKRGWQFKYLFENKELIAKSSNGIIVVIATFQNFENEEERLLVNQIGSTMATFLNGE